MQKSVGRLGGALASRLLFALLLLAGTTVAAPVPETRDAGGSGLSQRVAPSPLLAIDQNRRTVIDRIVGDWGDALVQANAGVDKAQLRVMLAAMRADQLLAASLAGSLEGLRNILASALVATSAVNPALQAKVLGDTAADLVYTPVQPCRLFDTRPSQNGAGALVPSVIRTYSATAPVPLQGGPGGCTAPAGAAVAMIQINTLSPPAAGILQGGASGTGPFTDALTLYQPGDMYGTSVAMPLRVVDGRFDLVALYSGVEVAGDLMGYFRAPQGGFVSSVTAGTGLTGGTITSSGTIAADTTFLQQRVGGTCAAGSSIRVINGDGTVVCEADDTGTGTVTSVGSGTGLSGGPITSSGTLSVNTTVIQSRVTGTCAAGSSIRTINSDGTVVCEADDQGTGTVTSVGSGTGLTGGPITTSGSLSVNPAVVQSRVSGTCAAGSAVRAIAQDGTVTCEAAGGGAGGATLVDGNAVNLGRVVSTTREAATVLTSTGYIVTIPFDGVFKPAQIYYTGAGCTGTAYLNDGNGGTPPFETIGGKWVVFSGSQNTLMAPATVVSGFSTGVSFTAATIDNPTCGASAGLRSGWQLTAISRVTAGLPASIATPITMQ